MNYGEIKAAIIARAHRADLTASVPEFIALAESEYNRRTGGTYEIDGSDSKHNWLSDFAPDVYLYGGLRELCLYTQDDDGLAKYTALFERAVQQAQYAEVEESGLADEPLRTDIPTQLQYDITEG